MLHRYSNNALREGYVKGLREALRIIDEAAGAKTVKVTVKLVQRGWVKVEAESQKDAREIIDYAVQGELWPIRSVDGEEIADYEFERGGIKVGRVSKDGACYKAEVELAQKGWVKVKAATRQEAVDAVEYDLKAEFFPIDEVEDDRIPDYEFERADVTVS